MSLIYIVLVNYNGYKDTIECVESLKKINYPNYEIVIIDNASQDYSVRILKEELSNCILIESSENLGFAGGNNIGIKYALENGADYVMLLNNDTLVEPDFLTNMLKSLEISNEIGMVGCKIMYNSHRDTIWYGGGWINWFKFIGGHYGMREVDDGQWDVEKETDLITGCCMLIKKEIFEKVGLLSEEYFMYFEDVDFCVRVEGAGYKMWYNPKAVIYHKIGASAGGEESIFSLKWYVRNRLIFIHKYKNKVSRIKYIFSFMYIYTTQYIRYIQCKFKRKNERAEAILKGIKEGIEVSKKI